MGGWFTPEAIARWVRGQKGGTSVGAIAARFEVTHSRALRVCVEMVDRGELIDDLGGRLSAPPTPRQAPAEAPDKQKAIWRAAHAKSQRGWFGVADIALLAEASRQYARDYLDWLAEQGHLHKRPAKPPRATAYRVHRDAPHEDHPPVWVQHKTREWRRRKKMRTA